MGRKMAADAAATDLLHHMGLWINWSPSPRRGLDAVRVTASVSNLHLLTIVSSSLLAIALRIGSGSKCCRKTV